MLDETTTTTNDTTTTATLQIQQESQQSQSQPQHVTVPTSSSLEERIEELELKLSVLSRLLQQQQQQQHHQQQQQQGVAFIPIVPTDETVHFNDDNHHHNRNPTSSLKIRLAHTPPPPPPPPSFPSVATPHNHYNDSSNGNNNNDNSNDSFVIHSYHDYDPTTMTNTNRSTAAATTTPNARRLTAFSPHLESPALTFSKMMMLTNPTSTSTTTKTTTTTNVPSSFLHHQHQQQLQQQQQQHEHVENHECLVSPIRLSNDDNMYNYTESPTSTKSAYKTTSIRNETNVKDDEQQQQLQQQQQQKRCITFDDAIVQPAVSSPMMPRSIIKTTTNLMTTTKQHEEKDSAINNGSNIDNSSISNTNHRIHNHPTKNRNLSLLLLFDGDQIEYDKECHITSNSNNIDDDNIHHRNIMEETDIRTMNTNNFNVPELSSMTLEERQWLRPQIQQYLQQQKQEFEQKSSNDNINDNDTTSVAQHELSMDNNNNNKTRMRSNTESDATIVSSSSSYQTTTNPTNIVGEDDSTHNSIQHHQIQQQQRSRSQSITDEVNLLRKKVRTKWLEYLNSVQESTPDVDVQMEEFIKVPYAVETIMSFGFCICIDSFLYMCTVLPIRFIWSCLLLLIKVCVIVTQQNKQPMQQNPHFQFHRRHLYQLIQVFILFVIYQYVLVPISIGMLYHWIRGQAMIKLYVIIAMVEIFDRLFSSLGQDCLDSMYWNTVSRPRSTRFLVSVLVVLVYAAIHTLILFVHVATLNVAMNSADQALLTLLISGNFAEIKSSVFKKYNKAALFKITAQDICERFKLGLFLSLVLLLNVCQGMDQTQFFGYMQICGLVWCTEIIADWIKHAFITKFNFLPARVYIEYALLLAGDVTGIGHEGMSLDHSHGVVKRIGFAQIPLLCVMFRLLKEAAKYSRYHHHDVIDEATTNQPLYMRFLLSSLPTWTSSRHGQIIMYVCFWLVLLLLKLILGRLLQDISLKKLYAAPEYSQLAPIYTTTVPQKKKVQ